MDYLLDLSKAIKTEAHRLGFSHMGIAPAFPVPHIEAYLAWVQTGYNGSMGYLAREDTLAKRADPSMILEGCQRMICLAMPYKGAKTNQGEDFSGKGRVASYALTRDYHEIIWPKLAEIKSFIQSHTPGSARVKSYVDTGPILERSYASQAGIGVAGKNSCLLIQGAGSYIFLAEILTDLQLPINTPYTHDLCAACQRCIDACPTSCILPDHTIDSRRCISYLTIEHKGIISDDLKTQIGDWVFGCDVCQMVCPHNARTPKKAPALGEAVLPELLDLLDLFYLDEDGFKKRFNHTAVIRAKRPGILRNAAIVIGNQRYQVALPVLEGALQQETDAAIQDACQWAILKIKP